MAATVLSGTGNVSYTNNTGQNVRIITNYLKAKENTTLTISVSGTNGTFSMSLSGGTQNDGVAIGRGLAYSFTSANAGNTSASLASANMSLTNNGDPVATEVAIEPNQTYSITKSGGGLDQDYNLIVIPESG